MNFLELSSEELQSLLPHGEGMAVIERVTSINEHGISCQSSYHLLADLSLAKDPNNTNRAKHVGNWSLIEFAAQAAALHQAHLCFETAELDNCEVKPRGGYIAQVKSATVSETELCDLDSDIVILNAEPLNITEQAAAYNIEAIAQPHNQTAISLVSARITLALFDL